MLRRRSKDPAVQVVELLHVSLCLLLACESARLDSWPAVAAMFSASMQMLFAGRMLLAGASRLGDLVQPITVTLLLGYMAYPLKCVFYFHDQSIFFKNWITLDSPLAHATDLHWALGLLSFAIGSACFCWGSGLKPGGGQEIRRWSPEGVPAFGGVSPVVTRLLWLALAAVIYRVIATWVMGLGAMGDVESNGAYGKIGGFIQLSSQWGGRCILVTAVVAALVGGRGGAVVVSLALLLAFGVLSTMKTGSKSDVILPVVAAGLGAVAARPWIRPSTYRTGMISVTVVLGLAVTVYPALHYYRYVMNEVTFFEFLTAHAHEIDPLVGLKDVLRRVNGVEFAAMILSYFETGGVRPPLAMNSQPFIVNELFGVPYGVSIGLGVGLYGGLLLFGGFAGLPALAFGFGVLSRVIQNTFCRLFPDPVVRAGAGGTLVVWLMTFTMFSANFGFVVKELIGLGTGVWIVRRFAGSHAAQHAAVAGRDSLYPQQSLRRAA